MDQIIFYGSLFLALVVNAVDGLSEWLREFLSLPVVVIVALVMFHGIDKWSIELAGRVEAIEKKLGIHYTPPVKKNALVGGARMANSWILHLRESASGRRARFLVGIVVSAPILFM